MTLGILEAPPSENILHHRAYGRWWRWAVLRGEGIPAVLDGRWFDLDDGYGLGMLIPGAPTAKLVATNLWESRPDGEVAVVYHMVT